MILRIKPIEGQFKANEGRIGSCEGTVSKGRTGK